MNDELKSRGRVNSDVRRRGSDDTTHAKEVSMKVSRVRFWLCKPCKGVYKKEQLELRIQMYEGADTVVMGTLECARCHAVYQVADIYSGMHDLPRENWREFQSATGEQIELV